MTSARPVRQPGPDRLPPRGGGVFGPHQRTFLLHAIIVSPLVEVATIPLFGWLSDHVWRRASMSLMDMAFMCRRSRMNTSCVGRPYGDFFALQVLDASDRAVLPSDHCHPLVQ